MWTTPVARGLGSSNRCYQNMPGSCSWRAGRRQRGRKRWETGTTAFLREKNTNIYIHISALNERRRWMLKAQPDLVTNHE